MNNPLIHSDISFPVALRCSRFACARFKVGDQREDEPFNNCIPQYDRYKWAN